MSPNIVCAENLWPVRWKNGAGWTRELLVWPEPVEWALRISVADIETDGPFSSFPGVDRYFAVLNGEGVVLGVDGEEIRLDSQSALHCFKGEADTQCRLLGGATRDFNLMLRRERAELCWHPIGEAAPSLADAHWSGMFSVSGGVVRELGGEWLKLPELSLAWSESGAPLQSRLGGKQPRGWLMQVRLRGANS